MEWYKRKIIWIPIAVIAALFVIGLLAGGGEKATPVATIPTTTTTKTLEKPRLPVSQEQSQYVADMVIDVVNRLTGGDVQVISSGPEELRAVLRLNPDAAECVKDSAQRLAHILDKFFSYTEEERANEARQIGYDFGVCSVEEGFSAEALKTA